MIRTGTRPRSFVLGGQQVGGLRDQGGLVRARDAAERGDDRVVDAGDADGGVGQVDDLVAGVVQLGQRGSDRDGLARADLSGDHSQGAFADAPGDPVDGLQVGGVPVQH